MNARFVNVKQNLNCLVQEAIIFFSGKCGHFHVLLHVLCCCTDKNDRMKSLCAKQWMLIVIIFN